MSLKANSTIRSSGSANIEALVDTEYLFERNSPGDGVVLVERGTGKRELWVANDTPTAGYNIQLGDRYLEFVSSIVETEKIKQQDLLKDLFHLARTGDVRHDGSAWVETGKFKDSVNASSGLYWDRKGVARILGQVNAFSVTPADLGAYLDETRDAATARAHQRDLGLPKAKEGAATGLRSAWGTTEPA